MHKAVSVSSSFGKTLLNLTQPTIENIVRRGFFLLSPAGLSFGREYHFEDHNDQGRELIVWSTGVAVLTDDNICMGGVRINSEAELIALLDEINWGKEAVILEEEYE